MGKRMEKSTKAQMTDAERKAAAKKDAEKKEKKSFNDKKKKIEEDKAAKKKKAAKAKKAMERAQKMMEDNEDSVLEHQAHQNEEQVEDDSYDPDEHMAKLIGSMTKKTTGKKPKKEKKAVASKRTAKKADLEEVSAPEDELGKHEHDPAHPNKDAVQVDHKILDDLEKEVDKATGKKKDWAKVRY